MSWNQSGNQSGDKNPWTGKQKSPEQGPPNLDEALRKLQQRLQQLFGKKINLSSVSNNGGNNINFSSDGFKLGASLIGAVILVFWLLSGIFIVDPAEQAVIVRFGKYVKTVGPGPHWIPTIIESQYTVNEEKISNYTYQAQMLTKDANIVDITAAVQYRVGNARDYLFNLVQPEDSLKQATASALRQVVGNTSLDAILTSGREQVRSQIKDILVQTLNRYQAGILITDVAIQNAGAPEAVKEAFDDAIKAQEDEKRFQNQARAYANQVEPIAKGQAQRLLADANAYKQQVVLRAKGDIASFLALLPEYQRSAVVTRERLYLDMMESVLGNTSKVLVNGNTGNNMFYLPLDKWFAKPSDEANSANNTPATIVAPAAVANTPTTDNNSSSASANNSYIARGGYQ